MEQFNTIYKILKILRDAMHIEEFDSELISAKALDVDEPFWARIMAMMVDKGYVKGIKVRYTFDSKVPKIDMVKLNDPLKMVHRSTNEAEEYKELPWR